MTRTDLLCAGLRASGALGLSAALGRLRRSRRLRILAYHRVLDLTPGDFAPDREVVSCTTAEFRREMAFVAREFDCVSFADLGSGRADAARRPLIITFDDGYKDNHDVAWPVLREHALKATFFVSTGYLDGRGMFWWDEIACLLGRSGAERVDVRAWGVGELPLRSAVERAAAAAEVLRVSKRIPDTARLALLESLRRQCGAAPADASPLMTWDDLRELAAGGMEIGSHTVSHPVLGNVEDPDALQRELGESRCRLEAELGRPADVLSYPVGRARTVPDRLVDAVRAAGYRYACIYEHGVNPRSGFDPFRLRRIKAEVGTDFARFRAKVLFPGLVKY